MQLKISASQLDPLDPLNRLPEAYLGEERRCGWSIVVVPRLWVLGWSSRPDVQRGRGLDWCWGRTDNWEHQGHVGALALDQSHVQAVGVLGGITGL